MLFARDPVSFLDRARRRYGSVFRVRFPGFSRFVYVTDPQLAKQVFASDRDVGRAGEARRDFLVPLVGENSLLCMEGEEWLRHRKLVGPAFHRRQVDGYAAQIAAIAAREIDSWPIGQSIALRPRMQRITLEVILRMVFGVEEEARLEHFRDALPRLLEPAGSAALWLLPPATWSERRNQALLRHFPNPVRSFLRARERVDELLYAEIGRRRAALDPERRDVLSLLLAARDDQGRGMSDVELRDELITLLEAGHETTATALSWTFERLVRHPESMKRLIRELEDGSDAYLDAVVKETLRTRPVVVDTPRKLVGPLELGAFTIPPGWHVAPAIASVQADPGTVSQPMEFQPERFLKEPVRDAWIPFGGGKRHCVGSHFALLEMRVVIRQILRCLRLEPTHAPAEAQRLHHVTLVPARGARVAIRPAPGAWLRAPSSPVTAAPPCALGIDRPATSSAARAGG